MLPKIDSLTRQLFTYPLTDNKPETVAKAKAEMCACASEMGFGANHTPFEVIEFHDRTDDKYKFRLEATFTA